MLPPEGDSAQAIAPRASLVAMLNKTDARRADRPSAVRR
jgi:hypothetical protein